MENQIENNSFQYVEKVDKYRRPKRGSLRLATSDVPLEIGPQLVQKKQQKTNKKDRQDRPIQINGGSIQEKSKKKKKTETTPISFSLPALAEDELRNDPNTVLVDRHCPFSKSTGRK